MSDNNSILDKLDEALTALRGADEEFNKVYPDADHEDDVFQSLARAEMEIEELKREIEDR